LGFQEVDLSSGVKIVAPGNIPLLYEDGFIFAVVSDALEEDAAGEQRYLERLYVNPDFELPPSICPDPVGNEGSEDAVEVEEEPVDQLCTCKWGVYKYPAVQLTVMQTTSSITHVLVGSGQIMAVGEGIVTYQLKEPPVCGNKFQAIASD
jgi:hypothetical protein